MRIRKRKNVFIVESFYFERSTLKAAGFWWHPKDCTRERCTPCSLLVGATWWTPDPYVVRKVQDDAEIMPKALAYMRMCIAEYRMLAEASRHAEKIFGLSPTTPA